MSRKPSRKKAYTSHASLKIYSRPTFGRTYLKSKFFMGSTFMLLLAGFVMYKSLLANSTVLGAYTTKLIAQNKMEDRRGGMMMEESRRQQEIKSNPKARPEMKNTGELNANMADNAKVACPISGTETRELSRDDCRKMLEKKRMELVEAQKMKLEQVSDRKEASESMETTEKPRAVTPPVMKSDQVKTRIELNDGVMRVKTNNDTGVETVRDLNKTEEATVRRGLEIEGRSLRQEDGQQVIESGQVMAKSVLPITVDPSTNQLLVTTSVGEKSVAVLPEQAVASLKARGIFGDVNEKAGIEIVEENGESVYRIDGSEQKRFLGIMPVELRSKYLVSTTDGSVTQESGSIVSRLFRSLSF